MFKSSICLNNINDVKAFASDIMKIECDVDLVSGRYIIDAKSVMGIFSLDLSKPIELVARTSNDADINELKIIAAKYIVK